MGKVVSDEDIDGVPIPEDGSTDYDIVGVTKKEKNVESRKTREDSTSDSSSSSESGSSSSSDSDSDSSSAENSSGSDRKRHKSISSPTTKEKSSKPSKKTDDEKPRTAKKINKNGSSSPEKQKVSRNRSNDQEDKGSAKKNLDSNVPSRNYTSTENMEKEGNSNEDPVDEERSSARPASTSPLNKRNESRGSKGRDRSVSSDGSSSASSPPRRRRKRSPSPPSNRRGQEHTTTRKDRHKKVDSSRSRRLPSASPSRTHRRRSSPSRRRHSSSDSDRSDGGSRRVNRSKSSRRREESPGKRSRRSPSASPAPRPKQSSSRSKRRRSSSREVDHSSESDHGNHKSSASRRIKQEEHSPEHRLGRTEAVRSTSSRNKTGSALRKRKSRSRSKSDDGRRTSPRSKRHNVSGERGSSPKMWLNRSAKTEPLSGAEDESSPERPVRRDSKPSDAGRRGRKTTPPRRRSRSSGRKSRSRSRERRRHREDRKLRDDRSPDRGRRDHGSRRRDEKEREEGRRSSREREARRGPPSPGGAPPTRHSSQRRGGGRKDDQSAPSKWDNDNSPRGVKREADSPAKDENGHSYGLDRKSRRNGSEPEATDVKEKWGKVGQMVPAKEEDTVMEKEKVNLATSGKLAEDTNTFRGVVVKYNEPPEAKKPVQRWRLYPFKGEEALPTLHIHRQSAYLIGRDRKVADIAVDHPSCSKQHAVLQYRSIPFEAADGSKSRRVLPYVIDLGSSNGTVLNGSRIAPQRYVELQEKDVLKFGFSSREFVVLNENSAPGAADEGNSDASD